MSIQAIKGVEIGMGFETARKLGSQVHDEMFYSEEKVYTEIPIMREDWKVE